MTAPTPASRSFFTAFRAFVRAEPVCQPLSCHSRVARNRTEQRRYAHTHDRQVTPFPLDRISSLDSTGVAARNRQTNGLTPFQSFLKAEKGRVRTGLSRQTIDQNDLLGALRRKDAEQIMDVLDHAMQQGKALQSVSQSTWLEIIRLVAPSKGQPGVHRIHRSMNSRKLRQIGYHFTENREKAMRWLMVLAAVRRRQGDLMGVAEYRLLLEYASRIGSAGTARALWKDLKQDGVLPDVACYNYYMEALVYDEKARLSQASRSTHTFPPQEHQFTRITLFKIGLSDEINELFREMASFELAGNTSTFSVLMTALSRDGDLEAVSSIMNRVWGIDVKAMSENTEVEEPPIRYSPTSPLYPNAKLLTALVNAYGSHNQVPLALRLVDILAHQYDIPFKGNLYYQIIQWTWLQARYRPPAKLRVKERKKPDSMTLNTVTKLLDTMVGDPYTKSPSIEKYHLGLRGTLGPFRADRSFEPMEDSRALYIRSVNKYRRARMIYLQATKSVARPAYRASLALLKSKMDAAEREKRQNQTFLQRFARIILSQYVPREWVVKNSQQKVKQMESWQTRGIPDFIASWKTFVASVVNYRIGTGRVQLHLRSEADIERNKSRAAVAAMRTRSLIWRTNINVSES